MKRFFSFFALALFLLAPFESAEAARKRKRKRQAIRTWSVSVTSGYTFAQRIAGKAPRPTIAKSTDWNAVPEGQMRKFFSSLDLARSFGFYELGGKIQLTGSAFVSPYFKWNMLKNKYRAPIVPSLTFGLVPSHLPGVYLRLSLGLALSRRAMIHPFAGVYGWMKTQEAVSEKWGFHVNTGFTMSMFL